MKKAVEKEVKEEVKEESKFNLEEAFTMWKNVTKTGKHILKGHDLHGNKLVGFFNTLKKNPKEPDIRICEINFDSEGKETTGKELCALWTYVAKSGKSYFTGTTDEKEMIVAFINEESETDDKKPYLKGYFQEDK